MALPDLDAVIGTPPYVRQENIPKAADLKAALRDQSKEHIAAAAEQAFPGINLSKQSDLHLYFWPVAAQFLKPEGWFGFLTSSSWLDARYGFALQRWILSHFRLVAVIESVHEPWFEDARVKTAATILQRCEDARKRDENFVRFVRLERPLLEILGRSKEPDIRAEGAIELRDLILKKRSDFSNDDLRIMLKRQSDLWSEGLSVAQMFARQKILVAEETDLIEGKDFDKRTSSRTAEQTDMQDAGLSALDYGGGKWGRYLRAPNFYFEIMREVGSRFTRVGDLATFQRGITSGCDDFFMPHNVSSKLLSENPSEAEWRNLPLFKRCRRADVENGDIVIVECGDHTLHPIEAQYVRPEIHSPMQLDGPIARKNQTDRLALWVNKPVSELKGKYVHDFIQWGRKQTFESKKSKSVPVPERETCRAREIWYDLTSATPGVGFWAKAQKYRHFVSWNPDHLICNCNLYAIHVSSLGEEE